MLATFALLVIARALGETPEQGKPGPTVVITNNDHLIRTVERFEGLWKEWVKASRVHFSNRQHPELDLLFKRTARVMAASASIISDIKMMIRRGQSSEIPSSWFIKILRNAKKAIISGQKITHVKEFTTWELYRPSPGAQPSDPSVEEYELRKRQNDKAAILIERRKKPMQCCMFAALVIYQFLHGEEGHDFVAAYEDELVGETFRRALSVDDAKTYEQVQMKSHCRARLTPPQDRIPRRQIPFGELSCTPRMVRNPMSCGMPIVTNQLRLEASESEYINLNRSNRPQHLGSAAMPNEPSVLPPENRSDYQSNRTPGRCIIGVGRE